MTTVLIIVCIVFCIGVVIAIVGHLGTAIHADKGWRARINRHHNRRTRRDRKMTV